ncbi:GntR family transcriptional regulator [Mesorhizobium sp. 2RAF21]|uniref:GntR family transcriptional regulator n=1 Tax=Mesorhizobium sp. 2RAF21 TaxID=3232995 RepID=UPI003F9C66A6
MGADAMQHASGWNPAQNCRGRTGANVIVRGDAKAKKTAVDKAYQWLRERILDGSLGEGVFIDEASVCDATGVSRTPAREAFNRLEGERFIVRVPRKGAQVRRMNSTDLHDAFRARYMVEAFAVTNFCMSKHAVPAEVLMQLDIMDKLDDFRTLGNAIAYVDADRSFHTAIVGTLDNRLTIEFFDALWRHSLQAAFSRGSWLLSDAWVNSNRAQHHAIVDALAQHDVVTAHRLLQEHLELPWGLYVDNAQLAS